MRLLRFRRLSADWGFGFLPVMIRYANASATDSHQTITDQINTNGKQAQALVYF